MISDSPQVTAAKELVERKRAARRLLVEHGFGDVLERMPLVSGEDFIRLKQRLDAIERASQGFYAETRMGIIHEHAEAALSILAPEKKP